ncbi:MAG: DUF2786 domain-containing protein [Streptosporangiaceae bacterium]
MSEDLISAAVQAQFGEDLRAWDTSTARLSTLPSAPADLRARIRLARETAADRGWREEDLLRHVSRFRSLEHARLLSEAPAGFEEICRAVDVLCTLARLPRLEKLGTRSPVPHSDPRMLAKIRALLGKAESTEFPAEAEALVGRAQQLITRHSIDQALLAHDDDAPTGIRIGVDNPYEQSKATLLHVVADANRCRSVWHKELYFSTVLGFEADLAAVEMLFTSLLVQADTAMLKGRNKRFRQSFLTAYAHRIGERLTAATADVVTEDLLPVLATRDLAVDAAVDRMFPRLTSVRTRRSQDLDGWVSGRAAADAASLRTYGQLSQ